MKDKPQSKQPLALSPMPTPRVEIINLIDVTITLIAFFLLTTVFGEQQREIAINLPHSETAEIKSAETEILLELDQAGTIYFEGVSVSPDRLVKRLKLMPVESVVTIRGDRQVPFQAVISLLDLLQEHGLTKISFQVQGD